ncbi:hypothetical protein GCM10009815_12440 [Nocardioides marmoribigeumensis]
MRAEVPHAAVRAVVPLPVRLADGTVVTSSSSCRTSGSTRTTPTSRSAMTPDERDCTVAAQMLRALGVGSLVLLDVADVSGAGRQPPRRGGEECGRRGPPTCICAPEVPLTCAPLQPADGHAT